MKEFKVGVYEEQSGYYIIKAENKEQAKTIAETKLNDGEEMDKITNGNREILLVEELKK